MRPMLFVFAAGMIAACCIGAVAIVQTRDARQRIAAQEKAALDSSFFPQSLPSIVFSTEPRSAFEGGKPAMSKREGCGSRAKLFPDEAFALRHSRGQASRDGVENPELLVKLEDGRFISFMDSGCDKYVLISAYSTRGFAVIAHIGGPHEVSALMVSARTGRITKLNGIPIFVGRSENVVLTYGVVVQDTQPFLTIYNVADDRLLPAAWCLTPLHMAREKLEPRQLMDYVIDLLRVDEYGQQKGYTRLYRDRKGWTVSLRVEKLGMRDFQYPVNERCLTSPPDFSRL